LELLYGENFTEQDVTRIIVKLDDGFIVNEAELGVDPATAVGPKGKFNGRNGPIKAVVKNFHFSSPHHSISLIVMFIEPET
jgi:putative ABC transport system permease protein